jgi:hypothetical protein
MAETLGGPALTGTQYSRPYRPDLEANPRARDRPRIPSKRTEHTFGAPKLTQAGVSR